MVFGDLINRQTNPITEYTMHVTELLHTQIASDYPEIHLSRLTCLMLAVRGLMAGRTLQLTAIGRHVPATTTEKHSIKRIDRLLSNVHLATERVHYYAWQARQLIGKKKHPVILVDFSDVDAARTRFILRAAVAVGGRALPVYEEVHDSEYHPQRLSRFLDALRVVLPTGCRPVLVTDAGFRGTWRDMVSERGWYYVSRQRNRDLIQVYGNSRWLSCKHLYAFASDTPRHFGTINICRNTPRTTEAYLFHKSNKGRQAKTKAGRRNCSARSQKIMACQREPWLLLCNLPVRTNCAKKVIHIYRQRMQIEEGFRDTKSYLFGLSFRGNICKCVYRLQALLLVAALTLFAVWLAGLYAVSKQYHRQLQANTTHSRSVLSITTIGFRYLWRHATFTRYAFEISQKLLQARLFHYVDL